jgi:chitinase
MQPRIKVILASSAIAAASCSGAIPIPERSISAAKNALVQLDGSEVAGGGFHYSWRLIERPEGSEAEPASGQYGLTAVFPADRSGVFRAELLGGFGLSSAPLLRVNVVVENTPPEARPQAQGAVMIGDAARLDGWRSRDPDGDSLTYAWSVTERPEGSVAAIVAPDAETAWFTPDVVGRYTFGLIVHDGEDPSALATVTVEATPKITLLEQVFRGDEPLVVYSAQLNRLAVASSEVSRVFVYEVGSKAVFTVPVPLPSLGLALAPDGGRAAAVSSDHLSIIDLSTTEVMSIPLPAGAYDVAFGDGVVHLVSRTPLRMLYSLDLATGDAAWVESSHSIRRILRAPGQQALYGLSIHSTGGILKWDTSSLPAELLHAMPLSASHLCQRLWPSRDGSRVFLGSGQVYLASANPDEDMAYIGVLPPGPACTYRWIEHASDASVVVSATSQDLSLHDADTLAPMETISMPVATYRTSGGSLRSDSTSPRAVFVASDGSTLVVLLEIQSTSSSKRYGVYELPAL